MKVKSVAFRKNVKTGDYLHEHAEVCVELNETDQFDEAQGFAKRLVDSMLGLDVTNNEIEEATRVLEKARRVGKL